MSAISARAARGQIEDALGLNVAEWPWSPRLSAWVDVLVIIEESAA